MRPCSLSADSDNWASAAVIVRWVPVASTRLVMVGPEFRPSQSGYYLAWPDVTDARLMRKLGLHSQTELVLFAIRRGILRTPMPTESASTGASD